MNQPKTHLGGSKCCRLALNDLPAGKGDMNGVNRMLLW